MKLYNRFHRIVILIFFIGLFVLWANPIDSQAKKEESYEHGTTNKVISEKMLNNTPPKDYKINEEIQKFDAKDGEYNKYFLKDKLQTIKIEIDENNLNYLLQNANEKPSVMAKKVTIGDKSIGYVGLKTKGNYTLQHTFTQNFGSDRFSFTLNFGKYINKKNYGDKQKFFGCRKISLNNFFFDKTMMKEYCSYKLFDEMGIPASQYGLAKLYINNKYYGVYFMLEAFDKSILEQHYGVKKKELSEYFEKPMDHSLAYDDKLDKYCDDEGNFDLSTVLIKNKKGKYEARDELDSVSYLWEYDDEELQDIAPILPTVLRWQRNLTNLSNGKDFSGKKIDVNSKEYIELLEQVMDVDEIVRYFAVHSFLVQNDSIFVNTRNIGIYVDETGKSKFIPWDYDLSFGCYFPGDAYGTANFDLDIMYKNVQDKYSFRKVETDPKKFYKEFPIFNVIYQNKELMQKYYTYMDDCAKVAAFGGTTSFGQSFNPNNIVSAIEKIEKPLIEAASEKLGKNLYYVNFIEQPSGVISGLPNLKKLVAMRAEGVRLQVAKEDYKVTTKACDSDTLGNGAFSNGYMNKGNLAVVDEKTGLVVKAEYDGKGVGSTAPRIRVDKLSTGHKVYTTIRNQIASSDENLEVYTIDNEMDPVSDYELEIPLSQEKIERGVKVFAYTRTGGVKELSTQISGNVCKFKTSNMECIAIDTTGVDSGMQKYLLVMIIVFVAAGLIVLSSFLYKKIANKK